MGLREKLKNPPLDCLWYHVEKSIIGGHRIKSVYVHIHAPSISVDEIQKLFRDLYQILAVHRPRPFYPFGWCLQLEVDDDSDTDTTSEYVFEFQTFPKKTPKALSKLISYLSKIWGVPVLAEKETSSKEFREKAAMSDLTIFSAFSET